MKLRFGPSKIKNIASRYNYSQDEAELLQLEREVNEKGHLEKDQLRLVAKWKSPRSAGHVEKNGDDFVRDITSFALSTSNERARIESLVLLDGVSWPTASVILHLFHSDPYPILDFRAIWSANAEVPKTYGYSFWQNYFLFCRNVAQKNKISMRVLDRALWQYSKENQ